MLRAMANVWKEDRAEDVSMLITDLGVKAFLVGKAVLTGPSDGNNSTLKAGSMRP